MCVTYQSVCTVCMHVLAVSNWACSHLYIYENTSPHRLHRHTVLTLGDERKEEKATNRTKRAASKKLGNTWKHCPGLTCGALFFLLQNSTKNRLLKYCLTFHLNQTLGGIWIFWTDHMHTEYISKDPLFFQLVWKNEWTQRFILLNPAFFFAVAPYCVKLFWSFLF